MWEIGVSEFNLRQSEVKSKDSCCDFSFLLRSTGYLNSLHSLGRRWLLRCTHYTLELIHTFTLTSQVFHILFTHSNTTMSVHNSWGKDLGSAATPIQKQNDVTLAQVAPKEPVIFGTA